MAPPRRLDPGRLTPGSAPACAVLLLALLSPAVSGAVGVPAGPDGLRLVELARGLDRPVSLASTGIPGDPRLFVVLQAGRVVVWDGERVLEEPFLDVASRVTVGGERGLLSIAFHPRYEDNGLFFAVYNGAESRIVLARFRVSEGDPHRADPESEEILLEIPKLLANHNGGQLHFGPDGHLYLSLGDGGGTNDPFCHAQHPRSLLGKILRLDGDASAAEPPAVRPPDDNPFVGGSEFPDLAWVVGLRNPWRFSFDRATGDLWIGDVGQARREEIDRVPAGSGGGLNFGWDVMEGSLCGVDPSGCPAGTPTCGDPAFEAPVFEYDHDSERCAVIGGLVYRGGGVPALQGVYVFGDFCGRALLALLPDGEGGYEPIELPLPVEGLTSFGEDVDGELHLVTRDGSLQRLTGPAGPPPERCGPSETTLCLAEGRFRVEAGFRPADALLQGRAVRLTSDTGYFWVFDEANVELVVKVVDACDPFDRFWVFAGGLTDVGVELTVTDTERGRTRVYRNPRRTPFQPIQDTDAFATCP